MIRVVLNIAFLAIISPLILADNPCIYTTSDGTVDISSVAGSSDSPRYKDVQPPGSGWKYSFNPCQPFSEGVHCKDASVCQVNGDGSDQYMLGTQNSVSWIPPPGPGSTPTLKYSYQNPGGDLKQVTMNLFCVGEGEDSFEFVLESPTNTYNFNWRHKCLCWDACKGVGPTTTPTTPGGSGGLTFGGYFLIILPVLLVVYVVVFVLINRFARQQTGLDMLPHRGFWGAIPGYTKDGVMFLVSRVTGKGGNYQSV